jgi:hypothetical protein
MNPLHPEQDQNQGNVSWAQASAEAIRFEQVKQAERADALRFGSTQEQAADQGQVAAWLDKEARRRRLRVLRCTANGGRIARHHVLLLEENDDGEVVSLDIGGYVHMEELRRGAHGGTAWLHKVDRINDEWLRVEIMITDIFPDHEMFKRSDGSRIDLGFNDNEHYYSFTVEIHQEDLVDTD